MVLTKMIKKKPSVITHKTVFRIITFLLTWYMHIQKKLYCISDLSELYTTPYR